MCLSAAAVLVLVLVHLLALDLPGRSNPSPNPNPNPNPKTLPTPHLLVLVLSQRGDHLEGRALLVARDGVVGARLHEDLATGLGAGLGFRVRARF